MKIEELRIGLWVYLFGDAVQLTSDHMVYLLARNSTPEPITLTEEWLIKFGFEKLDSENEFDKDMYSRPTKSSTGRNLPFIIQVCLNGSYSPPLYMDVHEEILTVHQLQNLYLALTSQELTLSPPQR